ncbi:MAG: gamma-glutamyl-gamma-aminobutyrate hydrolase family protein [Chloroflexi bacterium]|nr:gamma-glutamyl-gamma-aminobutyrate hydrolase family protein [Chloroflexota bacterium]
MKPLIGLPTRTFVHNHFTFHALTSTYSHALELAGGLPVLIPLRLDEDTLRSILARLDGLLLAGGIDVDPQIYGETVEPFCGEIDPERDRVELYLARRALQAHVPILGMCRGIQSLNVAAGGSLYQDIAAQLPGALRHDNLPTEAPNHLAHAVDIAPESRLARALGTIHIGVNSRHHQSIKQVAPAFHVVARAPDGIIEGIEADDDRFALAVQFHPELLVDDDARMVGIFRALVEQAEHQDGASHRNG